jgi:hypothetical protein
LGIDQASVNRAGRNSNCFRLEFYSYARHAARLSKENNEASARNKRIRSGDRLTCQS